MKTRKKKQDEKQGVVRWLRIGTLTLSTLGPLVNSIATRVREQKELRNQEALAQMLAEQQARLTSAGSGLLKRGGQFSQRVAEQSNKMTHDLAQRGNDLTYELGDRGARLAQSLKKRSGNTLMYGLGERGEQLAKQLKKRTRKAQRKKNAVLIALGFGVGLVVAAIATIFFIRQRLQRQHEQEEETHIQLDYLQDSALIREVETPVDAALVGVVSTKHYYPIETPLEQLETDEKVDIIYFSSEDEARELGFTPALA